MSRGRLYNPKGSYLGQVNNFYTRLGEFRMTLELDNGNTLQFNPGELRRDRYGDWHVRSAEEHVLDSIHYVHLADRICKEISKKEAANMTAASIKNVIFNPPATVVYWSDGTKTVVKCSANDMFDPEKGLVMAIAKRCANNSGSYYREIKKWVGEESCYKANFADMPKEKATLPADNALLKKYVDKADADLKSFVDAATTGDVAKVMLIFGALNADLELLKTAINK